MKPIIYLSNWSSHKTPGHHGPGRKLSIMAYTPKWAPSAGRVPDLTPEGANVLAIKAGQLDVDEYRRRFESGLHMASLSPGSLSAADRSTGWQVAVQSGDTLCCVCGCEQAAAGRCHRVWAAEALARAGWRVILDGVELTSASEASS